MNRFIKNILALALALTGALASTSCLTDDSYIDCAPSEFSTAEISFLADVPSSVATATRGQLGSTLENSINNIYVLVFEKDGSQRLLYKGKGKNLSVVSGAQNNNKVKFKATLPVGAEYTFMVLANAENKLSGISVGDSPVKTKSDVVSLTYSLAVGDTWDQASTAIPMWGEKNLSLTASSSPTFSLTRMLARINMEYNPKLINGEEPNNFKLTSVRYYNYNTSGTLASAHGNYTVDGAGVVTATNPSLPGGSVAQVGEALLFSGADIYDNRSCKDKIYVFEAAHNNNTYTYPFGNSEWIDNPCLVIGGQYSPDDGLSWGAETYYRIDFIKKDKTDPNDIKDIWLSVLRNFSYNVTVTEVSGEGYPTPGGALKSAPINIEANVLDWHERDMGEIVFDGVFYLSVSRDEFVFQRNASSDKQEDNVVYVKTDYVYDADKNHAKSGWKVDRYEHIDGKEMTEAERWLTLVPSSGAPDVRTEAYFTYKTNEGHSNREANVWVSAGRLRYKMHVVQRVLSLEIVDDSAKPMTEMLFVVPRSLDRTHLPINFKVNWTPIGENVAITMESPRAWVPFEPGWISPNPDATQSWVIPGGTGTQSYVVQPPAVSDSELVLNPFYERESTYLFEVNNGYDSEKKCVNLRQIYYNILVDTYNYRLDGKTYTVNVRSNTDWVITDIEEWLFNVDPATLGPSEQPSLPIMLQLNAYDNLKVGTTGGHNTTGESVAFTVVNQESMQHQNKWGTIWVTFENPDGKFPPQRVALRFPPRSMTLLGLGYARDVRGFNVAFPSTYHLQSLSRMLTAPINYGNLDESVVKVDGFKVVGYNCEGSPLSYQSDANWYVGALKNWLNEHKPDIIVLTYSMNISSADAQLIKQYLQNGGAVIMYYGGDMQTASTVKTFMDVIFERSFTTSGISAQISYESGSRVYQYMNVSDPVLEGPFLDVKRRPWGVHLAHCNIQAGAIQDKAHILSMVDSQISPSSSPSDIGYANIFRHKEYNLLWVGNAMGTATYYPRYNDTEYYHDPNRVDNEFRPAVRTGFGGATNDRYGVYNSYFFANAVAWGMSVTNHTPPPGGY